MYPHLPEMMSGDPTRAQRAESHARNSRSKPSPPRGGGFGSSHDRRFFSFSSTTNLPGMAAMPGMFLNMDIGKLREMALAARAGNQAEAARLYQETFGVSPEEAQQAAELMSSHHHIVLSQMQMGAPQVFQMGSVPAGAPPMMSSGTYNLPSSPISGSGQPTGRRWGACLAVALVLLIAVVVAGAIVASALLRAR